MSMMWRQTEISIVPSSHTHKEIPVSVVVTSTAPKLPNVACKKTVIDVRACEMSLRTRATLVFTQLFNKRSSRGH